jgi:hypothetical protein
MKKIIILAAALLISAAVNAQRITCKGTTKAGQPCQSTIVSKATGYCRAHDPAALRCGFIKPDGQPCKMVVSLKGELCRFHKK